MNVNKPTRIITHHAWSSKKYTTEMCDADHRKRWPDFYSSRGYWVGYHFFIEWDGTVRQTRALGEEGAHTIGMNRSSIGVCFAGNMDKHMPSEEQKKAWKRVYKKIRDQYPNLTPDTVVPHRKYAPKSCHGALLADDYYGQLVRRKTDAELKKQYFELLSLYTKLLALVKRQRMQ